MSEHVDLAATVYTDEFGGYNTIPQRRKTVCHSAGEYVRGQARTNGIESFWALLKRVGLAPITGGEGAMGSATWRNGRTGKTPWASTGKGPSLCWYNRRWASASPMQA